MSENKTSMAYWLPKILHLTIPMPKTVLIPVKFGEGGDYLSEQTHAQVEETVKIMGYPVFIKTDMSAGKHSYTETCFVANHETLHFNLERLRDDNFCTDCFFKYFAIRKFIELDWKFKAFKDLPIAPERRYFIEGGKVLCHHPYWPPDAMEFYNVTFPDDFSGDLTKRIILRKELQNQKRRETLPLLLDMNDESPEEIELLTKYSEMVAQILPEYWSVDFALGRDKKWYLIDMAEGDKSYHDDECPIKQKRDGLL
jgi:hypothetical protein